MNNSLIPLGGEVAYSHAHVIKSDYIKNGLSTLDRAYLYLYLYLAFWSKDID